MNFRVISLFPEMILSGLKEGVVATGIDKKIISVEILNPRKFTSDVHHSVDDRPFGGGDGMLMLPEVIDQAVNECRPADETIYLSARGEPLTDQIVNELSGKKNLTLLCGRYGGIDQRVIEKNKLREISIGDYILSGGELAALILIDSVSRKLPGILGNTLSSSLDSFSDGLLEAPSFTRGRTWQDLEVPPVLLSGDHKKIEDWKRALAILSTIHRRPDLFEKKNLPKTDIQLAKKHFEMMSDQEKFVCGLRDLEKIRKVLKGLE